MVPINSPEDTCTLSNNKWTCVTGLTDIVWMDRVPNIRYLLVTLHIHIYKNPHMYQYNFLACHVQGLAHLVALCLGYITSCIELQKVCVMHPLGRVMPGGEFVTCLLKQSRQCCSTSRACCLCGTACWLNFK